MQWTDLCGHVHTLSSTSECDQRFGSVAFARQCRSLLQQYQSGRGVTVKPDTVEHCGAESLLAARWYRRQ